MKMKADELLARDIGRMVMRIDSLAAQLDEALEENEKLKEQLAKMATEVHTNGA